MLKTILIAGLTFSAAAVAAAEEDPLPRFDVAALCEAAAGALGNSSFALTACVEQEQQTYARLRGEGLDPETAAGAVPMLTGE